jgi:tol-pal system protein YbgF
VAPPPTVSYGTPPSQEPSIQSGPQAGGGRVSGGPAPAFTREQENKAYDVGSNLFRRNDYIGAIRAFETFSKDFPTSQLVANAQYWIGIAYFNLKDYSNARSMQESLLKKYPESAKAPDALLAIASVQQETGDNGSARNTLEDIVARFPSSEAAAKARTRLVQRR